MAGKGAPATRAGGSGSASSALPTPDAHAQSKSEESMCDLEQPSSWFPIPHSLTVTPSFNKYLVGTYYVQALG